MFGILECLLVLFTATTERLQIYLTFPTPTRLTLKLSVLSGLESISWPSFSTLSLSHTHTHTQAYFVSPCTKYKCAVPITGMEITLKFFGQSYKRLPRLRTEASTSWTEYVVYILIWSDGHTWINTVCTYRWIRKS